MERSAKRPRPRQACEPCRRKKAKCSGEKPECAYCARLGQACAYRDEAPPEDNQAAEIIPPTSMSAPVESRLQVLEHRLDEILSVISDQGNQQDLQNHRVSSRLNPRSSTSMEPSPLPSSHDTQESHTVLPSWDVTIAVAEQYLIYCDGQPLPLFHRGSFLETLPYRDPELVFAILALSLRFSNHENSTETQPEQTQSYVEKARLLVMRRITTGKVELSTLQSLCLLSLVDFTNGHRHRASIHLTLAINLAQCAGLSSESHGPLSDVVREERRRCFWGLTLLKRLQRADLSVLDPSGKEDFPAYPASSSRSSVDSTFLDRIPRGTSASGIHGDNQDAGILAYAIQLSEVWSKTTRYALRRGKPSKLPPWSPQSDYSTILNLLMDLETRVPYVHRFRSAEFTKRSPQDLHTDRAYWAPWLFVQFLYHTILCLLNHPLLLALRLRNFPNTIPEIFLQHSSDLISSHSSWIVEYIDMLEAKSFKITDPFLGHCVAIIATVQIQESFIGDEALRREKRANFAKCVKFTTNLGEQWPNCARMAKKLEALEVTISTSYHSSFEPSDQDSSRLYIDLGLFWEILEYSSVSEGPNSARQIFGPTLHAVHKGATTEVAEASTLPQTTRVESAFRDGSRYNRSAGPSRQGSGLYAPNDNAVAGTVPQLPFSGELIDDGVFTGQNPGDYGYEEMAVLANGFFSQRNDFVGNVNDWWRTGDL